MAKKKADSKETVKEKEKDTAKKADAKKKDSKKGDSKKAQTKKKGGVKKYFRDLKSEIKKVVWPSRSKVINNTGIVLGVILVMGLALFGIDFGLSAAVNALLSIGA